MTFNGYVSSNNNTNVSAWFEWGINSYYGYRTIPINYGANIGTSYNYYLSGLSQNTIYYFRAVAQSGNGAIVYGNTSTFITSSNVLNTNNIYTPTTNKDTNISTNTTHKNTTVTNNTKNNIKNTKTTAQPIQQGALAFLFGDGFLPNNLLGWLLIILFINLLILSVRKAYYDSQTTTTPEKTQLNGKSISNANK